MSELAARQTAAYEALVARGPALLEEMMSEESLSIIALLGNLASELLTHAELLRLVAEAAIAFAEDRVVEQ